MTVKSTLLLAHDGNSVCWMTPSLPISSSRFHGKVEVASVAVGVAALSPVKWYPLSSGF